MPMLVCREEDEGGVVDQCSFLPIFFPGEWINFGGEKKISVFF